MDIVFDRRGEGPPLVLLHGIGHRRQGWTPVMDLLAAERDVIAVDLPGFGDSPPLPPGTPYTLDTVISILAGSFAELGLEKPHIAGNSLGGLFALEAADRGLASSATVLSPAGFFNAAELRYAASVLRASRLGARVPDTVLARLARSPRRRTAMFGMIYGRPDLMDLEALTGDARAMREAPGFEPTLRAGRTARFAGSCADVPVTIAWGTKDRLLLRSQAIRAQRKLPHARFVWLEGCGHVPMADDPSLVAEVLLAGSAHPLKTQTAA
ncbi:alpha/beta fold hydrolase [Actinomadura latina]|uniref:Alpha/beta hydrolase n=1 Tax=Actinomadura latina TaxID=163603 RepID=A0A846YX98_9ACTN|nr:alpha/beta hydrolase [Actinomadura latina]NKZ05560.1 alpha/beta hydrolase [Actinomadura latina]